MQRVCASAAALLLAIACTPASSPVPVNTVLDATSHEPRFPISPGSKHALGSDAPAIACNSCHGAFDTFARFDCLSCHQHADQAALAQAHRGLTGYAYASASCYACHPRGTASGALPTGPIADPSSAVNVAALIPSYSGTTLSALTPQSESLPMPMDHASAQVAPTALVNCAGCHSGAGSGTYRPGRFHASLATAALAQPTACLDCHATSAPSGFVGPLATHPPRSPASGEMKHDAVLWSGGRPTSSSAAPQECALCHASPAQSGTWASGAGGAVPLFHTSLAKAALAQPGSCVDCHANSLPSGPLTSSNSSIPANLQFDHASVAIADCVACHGAGAAASQWSAFSDGMFHLAGSTTPASCLPCHAGERPTSIAAWTSPTFRDAPFDFVPNAQGVTHGDGADCAACHSGPGSGTWGGAPGANWTGGRYQHDASTSTCIACHSTQRPDLQPTLPADMTARLNGFDHALNGAGDCFGCHQASVTAGAFASYDGDWQGGKLYPGATLVGSPSTVLTINELLLARAPSGLVTGATSTRATLYSDMLHTSAAIPAEINPGPAGSPDTSSCWHCHAHAAGSAVVSSYAEGRFHSSLNNYAQAPGGAASALPQPGACLDCHAQTRPAGIVEQAASDLQPMDHAAQFTSTVVLGGATATGVDGLDCALCHKDSGGSWAGASFHANLGAAVPADCTACHYPLMADGARADLSSGASYAMKHGSAQLTSQACQACHGNALANATTAPLASMLWKPGTLHASVAAQPTACLDCHAGSAPAAGASTQSSTLYVFANGGGTATNQAQWTNHGAADIVGKDCARCHAADAKRSGSAWSKSDSFHAVVASPAACQGCHGTGNGGGSTPGTNNNLPAGLSSSSTLTMASNDAATGVAPGTRDQISHADVNVTGHDCKFCHTQAGVSTAPGIQGAEWAQAKFHSPFTSSSTALLLGTTSGRCSNCHLNVKPGAGFSTDHGSFTAVSGTEDCATCHVYPGTGTNQAPNWYGALAMPTTINVGGFTIPAPPASTANTVEAGITGLPHPTVTAPTTCATCHSGGQGGKGALGYDHASTLIKSACNACHESGSNLLGTVWNGAASQSTGAGDTRPFTLTSVSLNDCTLGSPGPHFYPFDCSACHRTPTGIVFAAATSSALTSAWSFSHPSKSGSSSAQPCAVCHVTNHCGG